jgi:virulence-associated protein VagC
MQRRAKMFMNNRRQAVRLPKEFQFNTDEVFIRKEGEDAILSPRPTEWGPVRLRRPNLCGQQIVGYYLWVTDPEFFVMGRFQILLSSAPTDQPGALPPAGRFWTARATVSALLLASVVIGFVLAAFVIGSIIAAALVIVVAVASVIAVSRATIRRALGRGVNSK